MITFEELYRSLLSSALDGKDAEHARRDLMDPFDESQLNCLLHPEIHASMWKSGVCSCSPEDKAKCQAVCPFDALSLSESGDMQVDPEACKGCGACMAHCKANKLTTSKDIIPALMAIRKPSTISYALVAPAFLGQFSSAVTPGKLRTALKMAGFTGMIEVSLFADILTLKEALEFKEHIVKEGDFQLTSCCCPIWIAMIRKVYHELMPHMPGSVSPMIAAGRSVKYMEPEAVTVFIGPCVAKKSEAREKDIAGAIDYVLTFQEVKDIFDALDIDPALVEESDKDHSSRAGRIYAHAGGVAEAVQATVERLAPHHPISLKAECADGVPACRKMIQEISAGNIQANFYEGMGCAGGCVGGPKAIIPKEQGKANVEAYGQRATYKTPIDNPYVIELLHRLGYDTVESLLEESDIFTRRF